MFLGIFVNLRNLYLGGNDLTGCIPEGLQRVPNSDLSILGLPYCGCVSGTVVSEGASSSELVSDCNALLAVRDILAGSATLNWSVEVPITEWEGVTVHGTKQRVTALDLRNKGLTGTIPRGLDRLTNLEYLGLNGNRLTGPIPYSLVSLDKLQTLLLSGNMLTGCVPVRMKRVPNNDLDSLDLPLCDCVIGVAVPDAANNPGLVSDCTALLTARDVLAGSTMLNWSPSVPIAEWEGVRLGGRPRRVKMLFLSEKLTGMLSPSLGRLSSLEFLLLHGNQLTGEIPTELGSLANLEHLYLDGNELSGPIPSELGSLASLKLLDLSDNMLMGEIPPKLGDIANLEWLYLGGNELSGPIPAELGGLSNLKRLNLALNRLTGEIPAELGSLANLHYLNLAENQLTGCIPDGFVEVLETDIGLPFCSK